MMVVSQTIWLFRRQACCHGYTSRLRWSFAAELDFDFKFEFKLKNDDDADVAQPGSVPRAR